MSRFELKSSAFQNGGMIPKEYTCDDADISPPLEWVNVPSGARSLALIADDPDAPMGTWVHWVLYNLPATLMGLPSGLPKDEQLPAGGLQGVTDFGSVGYGGPCPPSGVHRYFFKLYALDTILDLGPGSDKRKVEKAMQGHVLAVCELMGKYRRNR